jgi:hypothetical protein
MGALQQAVAPQMQAEGIRALVQGIREQAQAVAALT